MEIFGDGKLDGGFYPIFKPKKMQVEYRRLPSDLGQPGFHCYGPNSACWQGFTATPDETRRSVPTDYRQNRVALDHRLQSRIGAQLE